MTMNQTNFNSVAIIGTAVTVLTFGGTLVGIYTSLTSKITLIDYQVQQLQAQAKENNELLKQIYKSK